MQYEQFIAFMFTNKECILFSKITRTEQEIRIIAIAILSNKHQIVFCAGILKIYYNILLCKGSLLFIN